MKTVLWVLIVVVLGSLLWVSVGVWSGLYSLYSIPPSKEYKDGVTFLVTRDAREPIFNSPDYKAPAKEGSKKNTGIGFTDKSKGKSLEERTILELPFLDWAYKKSLQPQD